MYKFTLLLAALCCFLPTAQAQQLHLPSSSNWINIGDFDIAGNQLTLEAFFFLEAYPPVPHKFNILSKHENTFNVNYFFRPDNFGITTYNQGNTGGTSFYNLFTNILPELGKWHHAAATYDGNRMRYYLNGCLVAELAASGNLYQNDFPTGIGQRWIIEDEQLVGYIDEVKIWNRALNDTEIKESITRTLSSTTGLLAHYAFDGDYTNTANPGNFDGMPEGNPRLEDFPVVFPDISTLEILPYSGDCTPASGAISIPSTQRFDYAFNGGAFSQQATWNSLESGVYTISLRPIDWCLFNVDLQINLEVPVHQYRDVTVQLCPGETFQIGNTLVTQAGIYPDTLAGTMCDTIINYQVEYFGGTSFFESGYFFCPGSTVEIFGPTPTTLWHTGQISPSITLSAPTLVSATWTSTEGCVFSDTTSFTFYAQEVQNIEATICQGGSFFYNGVSYDAAGLYVQTVEDAASNGCDLLVEISITTADIIQREIDVQLCLGEQYDFYGQQIAQAGEYLHFIAGQGQDCDTMVALTVVVNSGYIQIPPYELLYGEVVTIRPILNGIDSIQSVTWTPNQGLSCSDCLYPDASPSSPIVYTLLITDEEGCDFSASTAVTIINDGKNNLFAPNVFSPNADGINDAFFPQTKYDYIKIERFSVYSRWGELVFERENVLPNIPASGWDGTFRDKPAEEGVYVFVLEYSFPNGERAQCTGDVLLLR